MDKRASLEQWPALLKMRIGRARICARPSKDDAPCGPRRRLLMIPFRIDGGFDLKVANNET
jgi:hypothetical protein